MRWWLLGLGLVAALELVVRLRRRACGAAASLWGPWWLPAPKALSFRSHPYALYVKEPNADGLYPSNRLGYAGTREIAVERTPNSIRIYCVGGSTTEAHDPAQGPDSSWPGQLQDLLAQRFPHLRIECINAGAAGYTSAESLAEFMFRGIDLKPDLLLIYHNINDAMTCQMVEGFQTDYSHARRHKSWTIGWINRLPQCPRWWTYQVVWRWITTRYGKINALLYWISDPPWTPIRRFDERPVYAFERNITTLAAVARHWGCLPVVIKWECDWSVDALPGYLVREANTTGLCFQMVRANNEALPRVAQRVEGCRYLDVGPFAPTHFKADGVHFTPEGLTEMARRVADGIESLIRAVVESRQSQDRVKDRVLSMTGEERG